MFLRLILKSFQRKKRRLILAILTVALGTSLVSALVNFSLRIGEKVEKELRTFGPNLLLVPKTSPKELDFGSLNLASFQEEKYLREKDLRALKVSSVKEELLGYAPYIYGIVRAESEELVLTGTQLEGLKKISPTLELKGRWPRLKGESLVGENVFKKLGLKLGKRFEIRREEKEASLKVVGVVSTGGSEDNQILVDLKLAQKLLGKEGQVEVVQLRVERNNFLKPASQKIKKAFPQGEVKIVKRVTQAEGAILRKIQWLIGLASLLVMVASSLTIFNLMLSTVLERSKEVGLMRALGATDRQVAFPFLGEASFIGILGGLVGYGLGIVLAEITTKAVFGSLIIPSLIGLPLLLIVSLGLTLFASILPVKRALEMAPALVLRGE